LAPLFQHGGCSGEPPKTFGVVEIELHSQQGAAVQLSKILGIEQLPQQNRNDLERRELAIKDHMAATGVGREEAIDDLKNAKVPGFEKLDSDLVN
jgi:hypothetical protein